MSFFLRIEVIFFIFLPSMIQSSHATAFFKCIILFRYMYYTPLDSLTFQDFITAWTKFLCWKLACQQQFEEEGGGGTTFANFHKSDQKATWVMDTCRTRISAFHSGFFYKFTQPGEPVTFSAIFLGLLVSITGLSVEKAAAFIKL